MSFFITLNPLDVIIVNRKFCKELGEPYELSYPDMLQSIIDEYNSYDSLPDEKEKAIQKACCLFVGLVFEQPFKNGNKRSALSISLIMMKYHKHKINGYENEEVQEKFYKLLDKTMMKMEGDLTIKSELYDYLRENLIKI